MGRPFGKQPNEWTPAQRAEARERRLPLVVLAIDSTYAGFPISFERLAGPVPIAVAQEVAACFQRIGALVRANVEPPTWWTVEYTLADGITKHSDLNSKDREEIDRVAKECLKDPRVKTARAVPSVGRPR